MKELAENIMLVLPELTLAVVIMFLLMVGVFTRPSRAYGRVHVLALLGLVGVAMPVMLNWHQGFAFDGLFVLDGFACFGKILILLGTALVLLVGRHFVEEEGLDRFEYPILILFGALGMLLMISSGDFLTLYMGLELQSLALYVLSCFHQKDVRSSEAGVKYFVLGAVSSGILLFGVSWIYGYTGTTRFEGITEVLTGRAVVPLGLVTGLVFVVGGLAFKIAAVPFHMWTPDVYQGSPTPVTVFLAVVSKVAAVVLFVRVLMGPLEPLLEYWRQPVMVLSALSMILGSLAALVQKNIKRLLAYSSIGHVGYILMGVAAGSMQGVEAVLVYVSVYLVMGVGVFGCVLSMRRDGRALEQLEDLSGLARTRPGMALTLLIFMFSLAGIPPLAGFFGKLYVFWAALDQGLVWLAIVGALSSVVAAYYYLRVVKIMYFDEPVLGFDRIGDSALSYTIGMAAIVTGLFVFVAGFLLEWTRWAALHF